jgi:hypothetical protein
MPTNFPTSVDNFTNPTANDSLNLPSHSTQHANANDAIEAVEDYLLNGAGKTGLVLLNTTTVTASSSIAFTNVFSTNYDSYRIVFAGTSAASTYIYMRLGSDSSGNYDFFGFDMYRSAGTNANGNSSSGGANAWTVGYSYPQSGSFTCDVHAPFLSIRTTYQSFTAGGNADGSGDFIIEGGVHRLTNSYTDFTLTTSANITGKVRVYGYRN